MTGTMQIRDHLLQELQLGVKTSCSLIKLIREEEWDFRPQDNMRTLLQLVHHLTAIPASDLAILQEKPQPEVDKVEHSASDIRDTAELVRRFQANYDTFRDYIVSLSEDELLNKSTKAFYSDHGMVQVKWLIEVVTHTFHHRSQLYNYLKQSGHELSFFMLYG